MYINSYVFNLIIFICFYSIIKFRTIC